MPDDNDDLGRLLERARAMRAEARRAMELAQAAISPEVRGGLRTLAANSLNRAQELERRALVLAPPPESDTHATRQQKQQGQRSQSRKSQPDG